VIVDRQGPALKICWRELGGPTVDGPPTRQGFGSRLAELSIVQQLGGAVRRDWKPAGLELEMDLLVARLSREAG
jgi:hypothetical protein